MNLENRGEDLPIPLLFNPHALIGAGYYRRRPDLQVKIGNGLKHFLTPETQGPAETRPTAKYFFFIIAQFHRPVNIGIAAEGQVTGMGRARLTFPKREIVKKFARHYIQKSLLGARFVQGRFGSIPQVQKPSVHRTKR